MQPDLDKFILPKDRAVAIQFSGGRTSGMLLNRIVEANNGLPDNAYVLFQNTGREREETLDFVQCCEQNFGCRIHWLEFNNEYRELFEVVGHNSASRNGEPFQRLIEQKKYLPNVVTRFCTEVLKVRTARRFMVSEGFKKWYVTVGFRADEKKRVDRLAESNRRREIPLCPLYDAGITKRHVSEFWQNMPFNLELTDVSGSTPEGNCDGCFLKSEKSRAWLAKYHPDKAEWWAELERQMGSTFDKKVSWRELIDNAQQQRDWIFDLGDEHSPYCTTNYGGCHEY